MSDATQLLSRIEAGDPRAADELLPLVYAELRRLAASKMAQEAAGHTLQPTALVHEAWLRLVGNENPNFHNQAHFFAAAAEAMRRILVDHARRKRALRHGGGRERVELANALLTFRDNDDQLLALSEALDKLAAIRPLEAQVVKLRYFVGMTNAETAQALRISTRTAKYYWTHARAWLYQAVTGEAPG